MSDEKQRTRRENAYALTAVQALLGLIDPSVEAVALSIDDDGLHLRFWTHGDLVAVAEDADDVAFEMEAFLWPEVPFIAVEVLAGSPPVGVHEWAGRILYRAKLDDKMVRHAAAAVDTEQ